MMFKQHFKSNELLKKKTPEELGLRLISSQRIELSKELVIESGNEEICLVIINGEVQFKCEDMEGVANFKDMIYIPRKKRAKLFSRNSVIMYYSAPSDIDSIFSYIDFKDIDKNPISHVITGDKTNNSKRHVWKFIDSDFNCSRLMMGICEGSPGGWTAWPPHEHAEKREEVYVYFNMKEAFGIQCVYDDLDDPYKVAIVRDGDLVSIPRGYHPNVGCPSCRISYIYCMASKISGDRNFSDMTIQKIFHNS